MKQLILVLFLACVPMAASAAIDAYPFPNDELRARYNALIAELRCPQCLNTNLSGSDSMIAQDLRREVHRMLLEGHSDDEILDFMHERYGDFILYRPRLGAGTLLLWFGPLAFLLIGGAAMFFFVRGRQPAAVPAEVALDDDEARRLRELTGQ